MLILLLYLFAVMLALMPAVAWLIHRSGVLPLLRSLPDCNEDFAPF